MIGMEKSLREIENHRIKELIEEAVSGITKMDILPKRVFVLADMDGIIEMDRERHGDVHGKEITGGLVGKGSDADITNSYATGNVDISYHTGGGLAGYRDTAQFDV